MKRYIRYLYEYENGKKIRNVGFVKVEENDDSCIIHIHGKGLRLKSQTDMDVYAFFKDGGTCKGIWQGEIKNVNPTINYRLEFGPEDVGGAKRFNTIEGIILTNFSRPRYASIWNDMAADIENMVIVEKEENFSEASAPEESVENNLASAASDTTTSEERGAEQMVEMSEPEILSERSNIPELMSEHNAQPVLEEMMRPEEAEQPEMQEHEDMGQRLVMPEGSGRDRRMAAPIQQEMSDRSGMEQQPERAGSPQWMAAEEASEKRMEQPQPESGIGEPWPNEMIAEGLGNEQSADIEERVTEVEMAEENAVVEAEEANPVKVLEGYKAKLKKSSTDTGVQYRKITREQIAELPRREWRLANNSFLLHGYYNYHHLVLMDEDGNQFIGVPGIYHDQEKAAAEAFGFGNFVKWPRDQLELRSEECDSRNFGYWYRQISGHQD